MSAAIPALAPALCRRAGSGAVDLIADSAAGTYADY